MLRGPTPPGFRERGLVTTQRAEFMWDVEYDIPGPGYDPDTGEGLEHQYASFTSDDLLTDEEVVEMAMEKAGEGRYVDVIDVRITERWHASL